MHKNHQDQLLKLILKNIPINIFIVYADGTMCDYNDRMGTILAGKMDCKEISPSAWKNSLEVMQSKSLIEVEEEFEGRWFKSIKAPYYDEHNPDFVIGVIGISIDITDRKKADIAKQEILRNFSHDIRTPMTGLVGSAQLLLMDDHHDEETRQTIEDIARSGDAMTRMFSNVLEVIEIGNFSISYKNCDIHKVIRDAFELNISACRVKNITWQIPSLEQECLPEIVCVDEFRVGKILVNLFGNAVKFSKTGTTIKVRVNTNHGLKISVIDTGIGIDKKDQERIFENFVKLESSGIGTSEYMGSGTGLFTAMTSAQDMGGTITLESEPDKGSIFTLILPPVEP